jgi:glyoxylase-like metal-dependent hydrolase (beta-lactamase superfamily II)
MRELIKRFANVFSSAEELKKKLKKLGIHRFELPTPFPQVNTVNVYLFEGKELTLLDTGVSTPESWETFKKKMEESGYKIGDIKKILLTHGHVDHYGLAQRIVEESGARVYIHPRDTQKVLPDRLKTIDENFPIYREYFKKIGVPQDTIELMHQISQGFVFVAQQIKNPLPVVEGQKFVAGDLELTAFEFPGHTPGMVCYYNKKHRMLFSGDHVLRSISPNPLLELEKDTGGKFKSLVEYKRSLNKLLNFDIKFVLPGHFTFIDDVEGLIKRLKRFYRIRQRRLMDLVDSAELTPYELVRKVFPRLIPGEVFLGISEVIANLEVLEEKGFIRLEEVNGKIICRRLAR